MTLYSDKGPTSNCCCIGLEEDGESLCGGYSTPNEITDAYADSVWELYEQDRIHDDCEEPLLDLFGVEDVVDGKPVHSAKSAALERATARWEERWDSGGGEQ